MMSEPDDKDRKPFVSDGCTFAPSFGFDHCCIEHDRAYWLGGTSEERKAADLAFRDCIHSAGHPILAGIYYWAVRIGGTPLLPTPWRWGFGSAWPDGTREIQKATMTQDEKREDR